MELTWQPVASILLSGLPCTGLKPEILPQDHSVTDHTTLMKFVETSANYYNIIQVVP